MDKTIINPYEELDLKIYAYTLPEVPSHEGYVKIGDTNRQVKKRIFEQIGTAGLNPKILFEKIAKRSDGTWFHDRSLHRFLQQNGVQKKDFNGYADEWFYFNGTPERAEILTDKYINRDYDEIQVDEAHSEYLLRNEQSKAVQLTVDYYNSGQEPKEFLWNAKPRFGKTLTSYDFVRKINATNVLIVTNRPAIANSWFDDFKKFISWQESGMKFVSETDSLKDKALSREDFIDFVNTTDHENPSQITFISLQDLKGAKFAGGSYKKLEWVGQLNWDVLIIDEAHEGVDTAKTDVAFDKIKRNFTLHLSGTPFKALANNKFKENQIFNWSYVDEQEAKKYWDYTIGSNPYENLPTLSLFTYQMSKMIEDRVSKGLTLDDNSNVDFAFDLNEFFRVNEDGKFEYEASVKKFLDNLSSGKFPFATDEHRGELNHTFWLLPRVNSAKALEKMLKSHHVFGEYKIVLAAGDGISVDKDPDLEEEGQDYKKNEKSFDKVKKAISENKKTITLSVGQLTTGITIPEWSAVLMLSNIKSPSLYFQAAFRAQNPYEFVQDGKLYRKENAYIFDFAPERTLLLFDEFANNLSSGSSKTSEERKKKIKKLLNFFPVIGEDDEGNMHELDATEVLTIPTHITSTEVVKRGFMCNLLFANIAGIFGGNSPFKEILDKIKPEKNKRLVDRREVNVTTPMIDDDGNVDIPTDIVINHTKDIFGAAIYKVMETSDIPKIPEVTTITTEIKDTLDRGFSKLKETFNLNKTQTDKAKNEVTSAIKDVVQENVETYHSRVQEIELDFTEQIQTAQEAHDEVKIEKLKTEFEQKKVEVIQTFTEKLNTEVSATVETAVEKEIVKVEEKKKKTTEDDVRDHLRGFARTIPAFLMAYGDADTTLSTFEDNIDEPTFKELTSITIDEFKKLRDGFDYVDEDGNNRKVPGLFNEVVFNASIKEFFNTKNRLSNYFDETLTEDIFDYIPPQQTNQIFTPRRVVKLMADIVEENNPGIFSNYNVKFIDLYTKSGLYITEIVKRLNEGLKEQIPNSEERIKWILENQVYACAPSNIIYNIAKNYIFADFKDVSSKNIVQCDLTDYAKKDNATAKLLEVFGDENLKFDVIIGNPPYQEMDGGAQASASPIYHHFVRLAKELNPELVSFIMPTRWYAGGKGLDDFRDEMINDIHLRELHDWLTPEDIFPNTNIRGGVCYFLWDKNYDNRQNFTRVVTHENNAVIDDVVRPMKIEGANIFVRDGKSVPILAKVFADENTEIMLSYISPLRPFGFRGYFTKDEKFRPTSSGLSDPIICYGKGKAVGYLERDEVTVRPEWIDVWKLYTPRANNIGTELNDDNLNTFVGEPKTICTESYLVIGAEAGLDEASCKNLSTYLTTRFSRYLHSLAKGSQDATSRTFRFVPIQDFSNDSDIDWSVSVQEVDNQLYKKYGLSDEEINHIERRIKAM
ncbi:Eco57I restriction-modification methylase domain-containing protein [Bacillus sp. S/N-304-OC-R1]|uniref:Eco57I restriction-modification methylase domain-containing protein n=1 Tax=Bacillus sp. S/N-304-OC-R1 TaxID=2758034 RepID=UPI001C8D0477|nr:Eco57I restriction-modification methylase domain-containing protein [Bacillus sp. S/N-304-OC-R1]MBY0123189.1 Eco57I restriction-modification methylase domain-containing protein [Bacillus sp. S/N-304-OC-R1]